jgi:16S rRNA (guanine966-N2)-methyltransferase
MSERVRGAIFNMLGDIEGLTVLDAFAGSGALSLEAISRGAKHAITIDVDKSAARTIARNAQELGVSNNIKAIRASASGWSDNNPSAQFDIVFTAPPYDALQPSLVQKLVRHVAPGGIFVLDWPGKLELLDMAGLENITVKNYGDAQIAVYRKLS